MRFAIRLTFFWFLSTASIFGQQPQQIIVSGRAQHKVLADQASFSFSISAFGSNLRKAVEEARTRSRSTAAKLLAMGHKPNNLSTTYFHSGENYGSKPFLSSSEDYNAFITTSVVVDSLPMLEETLLLLSDLKIDNIVDIAFSLKDLEHHRLQAIHQAVSDGQRKAQEIAKQNGVSIKRIVLIEEQYSINEPLPLVGAMRPLLLRQGRTESASGFFPRELIIEATVKMAFEF